MNSMIPQRSAVTTLGYSSGKTTSSKSLLACKENDILTPYVKAKWSSGRRNIDKYKMTAVQGVNTLLTKREDGWQTMKENVNKTFFRKHLMLIKRTSDNLSVLHYHVSLHICFFAVAADFLRQNIYLKNRDVSGWRRQLQSLQTSE